MHEGQKSDAFSAHYNNIFMYCNYSIIQCISSVTLTKRTTILGCYAEDYKLGLETEPFDARPRLITLDPPLPTPHFRPYSKGVDRNQVSPRR